MPAFVKSSTALGAGGLSLLRQEVRVQSASEIVLDAEYCCLPAYAETWTQRLRIGAPTPLPAPSVISYYNLLSPLALATVSQNTTQGLTYFNCSFSAPRDPSTPIDGEDSIAPQFETTTQSVVQQQQLSGSASINLSRWQRDPQTREWQYVKASASRPWAFIYYAETKTVTASSDSLLGGDPSLFIGSLYISEPLFLQGDSGLVSSSSGYRPLTNYRTETSISSAGQRRYSLTGSIQYYVA